MIKTIRRRIVSGVFLSCIFAVYIEAKAESEIPVQRGISLNVPLTHWAVMGPIQLELGPTERNFPTEKKPCLTEADFLELYKNTTVSPAAKIRRGVAELGVETIEFHSPLGLVPPEDRTQEMFYAGCKIQTPEAQEVILEMAKDDWAAVYLDGHLLTVAKDWNAPACPRVYFPATFKKGDNFLLVKVYSWKQRAAFKITIRSLADHALDAALNEYGGVLSKQCYTAGELPSVTWHPALTKLKVVTTVVNELSGENLGSQTLGNGDRWIPAERNLPAGVYLALLESEGRQWTECFVIGDGQILDQILADAARPFRSKESDAMNVDTLLHRNQILLKPKTYTPTNPDWQQKFAFNQSGLAGMIRRLKQGGEGAAHVPGLHLRAFRSRIDDSVQHYRLFIPSNYAPERAIPLAILPCPTPSRERPFLESVFIAKHKEAVHIAAVAEAHGFAVLWSGYRNRPRGAPIELTHLDEALATVNENYRIDQSRISLIGICSGGVYGGMAVDRWPERFAALVYENGIFGRRSHAADAAESGPAATRARWLNASDPVPAILAHRTLPIFVINDGTTPDGHGEIELSHDFVAKAKAAGKFITTDFSRQPIDVSNWVRIFSFLQQQKPLDKNEGNTGRPATGRKDFTGPICQVFTDSFLVVEGTGGSLSDQQAIKQLSESFQNTWRNIYFGAQCRVRSDVSLTPEELSRHSLILLGNEKTNQIWNRCGPKLPLTLNADSLVVGSREWKGKELSIEAIFSSPYNADKYVVVMGAHNLAVTNFETVDLRSCLNGWYDFAIWDNHSTRHRVRLAAEHLSE
jgi:hypothetical protein